MRLANHWAKPATDVVKTHCFCRQSMEKFLRFFKPTSMAYACFASVISKISVFSQGHDNRLRISSARDFERIGYGYVE